MTRTIPIIDTHKEDEWAKKRREVVEFYRLTAENNPNATATQIAEAVADEFGVSLQFVVKHAKRGGVYVSRRSKEAV